ncbi:MAG: DUF92 domain-containing protein, partial [Promethearchaeota archaeon]
LKIPSGALAAFAVGLILFTFSIYAWVLLLTFFISSSLLSKFKSQSKAEVQEKFDKGGKRDAGQVIANSGTTIIYAVLIGLFSTPDLTSPLFIAIAAYFASVNADTFSTEIGILAKSRPRWILNPRQTVEKGTSGGVTLLGTFAGVMGALEIGCMLIVGVFLFIPGKTLTSMLIALFIVVFTGMCGNFIDSFLGATVQGFYFCPVCQIGTEKKIHLKCGETKTRLIRGWVIVSNDWVNLLSATGASLIAFFLSFLLL